MDRVYDTIKRQHNIPNALICIIKEYVYDWKLLFKQCIHSIERGTHITSNFLRPGPISDIYQLMCKKHTFNIVLSPPYTIKTTYGYPLSKSIPMFHCKVCRKYHNHSGVKICTRYGIKISYNKLYVY